MTAARWWRQPRCQLIPDWRLRAQHKRRLRELALPQRYVVETGNAPASFQETRVQVRHEVAGHLAGLKRKKTLQKWRSDRHEDRVQDDFFC